jgi:hypothetical protein
LTIDYASATDYLSVPIRAGGLTCYYSGHAPDSKYTTFEDYDTGRKISRKTWITREAARLDVGVRAFEQCVLEIEASYTQRQACVALCRALQDASDWWQARVEAAVTNICHWFRKVAYEYQVTDERRTDVYIESRLRHTRGGTQIIHDPMQALQDGLSVRLIKDARVCTSGATGHVAVRDLSYYPDGDGDERHPLSADYWNYVSVDHPEETVDADGELR